MTARPTVRVLLFDADRTHLLLIKVFNPRVYDPSMPREIREHWITVGGGIEAGESLSDAARREAFEETGIADVEWGPIVLRNQMLLRVDEIKEIIFDQTFIVGRALCADFNRAHLTPDEKTVILDHRWWSLQDIQDMRDFLNPPQLVAFLPRLFAGDYPTVPISF